MSRATAVRTRPVGRPAIGPKIMTRIPDTICEQVRQEAKRRGVKVAAIWREYIEEAHARRSAR
jgi:hypothetical protein